MMTIRVSSETKASLTEAATIRGLSLSAFVVGAATKEAAKPFEAAKSFRGVPTWFRASCQTAAQGGTAGYVFCGREFAKTIGVLIPYGHDGDSWVDEVEKFAELCGGDNREEVLSWLLRHYPKCMELVPARRREQFLDGVFEAAEEGDIEA